MVDTAPARHESDPHSDSDYVGDATIILRGSGIPVHIELRGYREPIDGVYRWFGRVAVNEALTAAVGDVKRIRVTVRTAHGAREAFLGDPDPWGRFRITGRSTPPFPVVTDPTQLG